MKEQLIKRLEQLKSELDAGQKMLAELDARRHGVQQALLRISGAIQVLEEECAKAQEGAIDATARHDEAISRMGARERLTQVSAPAAAS